MKKRLFAILLTVFMIASLLPAGALASDSLIPINVGGTYLNGGAGSTAYARINEYGYVVTGGEYINENNYDVSWDGSTLTLKNATIDGNIKKGSGVSIFNGSLTIVLIGDNKVIGVSGTAGGSSPAIAVWSGGLTIEGEGSLTVTGGGIEGTYIVNRSYGLYARNNITINSGTITAIGGAVAQGGSYSYPISYGICSEYGSVNISGGDVTATGGESEDKSYGIFARDDVNVTGGEVTANGGKSSGFGDSHGIRADSVNVSSGTVNANGGETASASYGIRANSVEVTGGVIYANNNAAAVTGSSYGIYSMGSVTIGDPNTYLGMVYAYGAPATGGSDSYGIYARGNVTMSGFAMVTATGGNAPSGDSFGISAGGNVEMSGNSTVSATGGSFGIRAGSVTWSGYSNVTASGGTSGISAEGDVAMSGYGEVTATGDSAVSDSCGIRSERGNVAISNGTVKASGSDSGIYAGKGDVAISGGEVSATGGRYGINTAEGQTIISGGESITASGEIQAINNCKISPVSGTKEEILGGDDAGSAVDVDADDGLSGHKYLNITFDVPASSITVGVVYLRGGGGAVAYAKTDAATGVVTLDGDEDNYNIKWDGMTLTLKDATISGDISHNNNDVPSIRLIIEGDSSINEDTFSGINQERYYNSSLTISGGGTLKISAGNTGINVRSMTIESGKLEITARQFGVNAPGSVTIKGGEVEVNGGNAFRNDTKVTVDPQSGKQICVYVGDSKAEAWALGTHTSETELIVTNTVNKYFHSYIEDAPIVTNVSVSPETATVEAGGTQQFTATVSGTGDYDDSVTWTVSGGISEGTTISEDGLLTVAEDETAESLTVTAKSVGDGTIYDTATVAVTQDEPEVHEIYIFGEGYDAPFYATTDGTPNSLTVCGENEEWNIKWDGEKLTLRDATVFCIMGNQAGTNTAIQRDLDVSLAIELIGDNTVVGPEYGIVAGNITISGDGTLRVWAHEIPRDGIVSYAFGGNVTITGGTVEAAGYYAPVSGSLTITPAEGGYELSAHDSFVTDDVDETPEWEAMAGAAEAVEFTAGSAVSLPEDTRYIKAAPAEDEPEPDPDWPDWPWHPGGSGGTVTRYVMLTFETRGGSELDELRVPAGTTVDLSDYSSERAGYDFALWYPDESFSGSIDEIYMDRDKTVYAAWEPFDDAEPGDWFYGDLVYVYENGLMDGVSDTLFAPDGAVTRGMIVTILHRLEGGPVVDYLLPFADVDEGAWYAEAVRWAASEGIVTGVSETAFAPGEPVTREQFAAILWRYAKYKGHDVSIGESTNILSYTDFAEISEYAIPAMQWACGEGIITGSGEGVLNPRGGASRAEAAAMLARFAK